MRRNVWPGSYQAGANVIGELGEEDHDLIHVRNAIRRFLGDCVQ
jgi:hypothetical protein